MSDRLVSEEDARTRWMEANVAVHKAENAYVMAREIQSRARFWIRIAGLALLVNLVSAIVNWLAIAGVL